MARPVAWGCLRITEMTTRLPALRFPIDVSGGVEKFRHRRGSVTRFEMELSARAAERWCAPRLRGIVCAETPDLWVAAGPARATACAVAVVEPEAEPRSAPAVAFDVHGIVDGEDLVLVVANARGIDLPAPPTAIAMACVAEALGHAARRSGAVFILKRLATAAARMLFPAAGARVPSTEALPWCAVAAQGDTWILSSIREGLPAEPTAEAVLAREVAGILTDADDALFDGDLLTARAAYLRAFERAPRHGEIARRIADIDARVGGRAEAALATLAEARIDHGSLTAGLLFLEVGNLDAALATFERAAEAEPASALSARAFELAAAATRDAEAAARWLDRALSRAPRASSARWARARARLQLGRLEDALADVEHLEALASGPDAKHKVCMRAGKAWVAAGMTRQAGSLFERALKFVPDAPAALAGLGEALAQGPHPARGVAVLERALSLATSRRDPPEAIALALARAIADRLQDLPPAIAHVSTIRADSPEAAVARGLEGRWRAGLGDFTGAGFAYARLRELVAAMSPSTSDDVASPVIDLLVEAAHLEETRRRDPLSAQRHLAVALRLRPRHPEALAAFRRVGASLVDAARDEDAGGLDDVEPSPPIHAGEEARSPPRLDLGLDVEPSDATDADSERRIEDLTRRLQADPSDDGVADELAAQLESLGRGHELLALLSARLDDASPARAAVLAPRALAALQRVADGADREGRADEAALYRQVAESLKRRHP